MLMPAHGIHHEPGIRCCSQAEAQTQQPIGSFEGHLSRDFKAGTWVSLDGNFWWGGLTSLSGIQNLKTMQVGSRLGGRPHGAFPSTSRSRPATAPAHISDLAAITRTSRPPGNIRGLAGPRYRVRKN